MTTNRFDALSRTLSTRVSRRAVVEATGLGLAAGVVGQRAAAQDATPTPLTDDKTFSLFVQTAQSGSFSANPGVGTPAPGGGAGYLLTLNGHPGGTVYFSDRPDRIFGEAPTGAFLDGLGFSPNNPPNAALVTQGEDGAEAVVILELINPTYDPGSGTITYGAAILDEYTGDGLAHVAAQQQDAALPETFGRASLFIDDCGPLPVMVDCTGGADCLVVGSLGELPLCWTSNDGCQPCIGVDAAANECNARYAACAGACVAVPDQFDVAPNPCTS